MKICNYIKKNDNGSEKHLPDIQVKNCEKCGEYLVTVQIGKEILHPSTAEHSIKTITLYGVTKTNSLEQLTQFQLGNEHTLPKVRASVKKENLKSLIATSYCNLHGLWENQVKL